MTIALNTSQIISMTVTSKLKRSIKTSNYSIIRRYPTSQPVSLMSNVGQV